MQVYLVGGAVRDELLGLPVSERDWVVVGATPQDLERQGFRPVGREFPVFLHPQTNEEYALARLERKSAPGYRGFTTQSSPHVTLEQDLQRRDLTINAMARAADGTLVDPYGGQRDLQRRVLRHVSGAFAEDPVRVLRVARFAARFAALGFHVAAETATLMRTMVDSGEVSALIPERVWREMERALGAANPEVFFQTLQDCGALRIVLPELTWSAADRLALQACAQRSAERVVRCAALLAGTATEAIAALCERLRVPNEYRELALLAAHLCHRIATARALDATGTLDLLEAADALRRPERFGKLLLACEARAQTDARAAESPSRALLHAALAAAAAVTLPPEQLSVLKGAAIAATLRARRIERLERLRTEHPHNEHPHNERRRS